MNAADAGNVWRSYKLRDVVSKLVDGSHNPPPKQDQGRPMLSARNIDQGQIIFDDFRYITAESFKAEHARTRVAPGDVLLTIVGTIGRSAVVPEGIEPFALQRSVAVLSPNSNVLAKFLAYQFQSPRSQRHFEQHARGTAQKGVYLKTLGETPILVPSIREQNAIVAEIEKQFSRLDKAVANLKRVKVNLSRYRGAVLNEAFASAPAGSLGDILSGSPQNGLYLPKSAYGSGTPMLRIDDYQAGWHRAAAELRRVRATPEQIAAWALREGDLVINRVNSASHLGKCMAVPAALDGVLFESNMMRMALAPNVLPRYVELYLCSAVGRQRLTSRAKWAINQASINQVDVQATPIPLPPLAEQRHIVAEVDRRLSIVREVEAEVDANLQRAQALRQAVLAQAFTGTARSLDFGSDARRTGDVL